MKAISVKQPYAELIASGRKSIEVRTWQDSYRGPLLIVASSQPNRVALENFDMHDLPCGVAVCVVGLTGIHRAPADVLHRQEKERLACCELRRDDLLWHIGAPRRVKPVAIKGRLRLYDVDDAKVVLL